MDYFDNKDTLGGLLLLSYFLYSLIIFVLRYLLKKKSTQIIKIPVARNTIQFILLIILTYVVTIPVLTYYFSKGLRLIYHQFVDREDYYLNRQGFFLDRYDNHVIAWVVWFYFFLIIKLIFNHITRYTIRKDNYIILSMFTFLVIIESYGKGYDIRTYSHFVLTECFFLIMYFVIRNKVIKDFHKDECG
jgi:small-conductance mechanosensitive channel